jgi:hypothetical protein
MLPLTGAAAVDPDVPARKLVEIANGVEPCLTKYLLEPACDASAAGSVRAGPMSR